jgi:hypothetical protein
MLGRRATAKCVGNKGIGLPPDIYSKNSLNEVNAGIDMTLEAAIDQLN